jgi:DNA-binding PadR family transcriptional regulator
MDAYESEDVSKTELILSYVTEHGPKTEYDLYKQFPKLSHGTIHFCLNRLTSSGALTSVLTKSGAKRRKKLYHLTFVGTVLYLASFFPPPSVSEKMTASEVRESWEHFEKEDRSEITKILSKQGKLLKYAPFQEIKWLSDRVPKIISVFLVIANWISEHLPTPYVKKPIIHFLILSSTKEPHVPTVEEMLEKTQDAWRDEFTNRFFEVMRVLKHEGKMHNYKLRRLAEEQLAERKRDLEELEYCVMLFSKSETHGDVHL